MAKTISHYRSIETLQEYVLIDPDAMSVECYRLNAKDRWELYYYGSNLENQENCHVELTSIGLKFPITSLYEDINFPENQS